MKIRSVPRIYTKYRKIFGIVPNVGTLKKIKELQKLEPVCMSGQSETIWDHAEEVNVYDVYGNKWLDFSSGVLITNAGHGNNAIVQAIINQVSKPLLTSYCFPNQPRIDLIKKIASLSPRGYKTLLLSTGSESTEVLLKLMRTYGSKIKKNRNIIISFQGAFHGRTLGAQQMGGSPALKSWIKNIDSEIVQVPFPDGFRCKNTSFQLFKQSLNKLGINPRNIAGVISETYQGGGPYFFPKAYVKELRFWCNKYDILLCLDEVQSGFGRCGKQWGFQHYDIVPDLFAVGKGISSSLPISAVIGRPDVMDLYGPNEMTSTHSGNPVCCAAALANINYIKNNKLIQNASKLGAILNSRLLEMQNCFPEFIGFVSSVGLVGGIHIVQQGTIKPDGELAKKIVNLCYKNGLMMFAPVGTGGACIKIAPPLCITEEALKEGCDVIFESLAELLH
ncbi:MAG: aspartate aminotransferase family protein [Patescibacteria group bacterium]